jgi:hypothetical protein
VTLTSAGAAAAATVAGSPYTIVPSAAVGTGLGNYQIVYSNGALTVTQAPLEVTADDKSKIYGAADPALTWTITGGALVGGDTLTGALTRDAGSDIGTYPIRQGSLSAGSSYTMTFVEGEMEITQAPLTIRADDKTKVQGQPDPPFTATFTGLAPGESPSDLNGTLMFDREPGEDPGDYLITPSALTSDNYAITFVRGVLSILDVAPDVGIVSMTWTLNMASGLFMGRLTARNDGDGPVPADYDYWFELPVATEWWLWNTTGELPDGKTYLDLTSAVRASLRATGNGDEIWDPGERITVAGITVYHRRRVNPSNYVDPSDAFVAGRLFQSADKNRNFVVDAQELGQAVLTWEDGQIEDRSLLDATRLERGAAYRWDRVLGTWRVLDHDER